MTFGVTYVNAATYGQKNATRTAQSYLASGAFSKRGLLKQLKYEGFTKSQAQYGVKKAYK